MNRNEEGESGDLSMEPFSLLLRKRGQVRYMPSKSIRLKASLRSLKSLDESLFDERRLVAEGSWDLTLLKLDGRLDLNL